MTDLDKAQSLAMLPIPAPIGQEQRRFDSLSATELVGLWRRLHATRYRDWDAEIMEAFIGFDHLPSHDPARALAFLEALVAAPAERRFLRLVADKFLGSLLWHRPRETAGALEALAIADRDMARLLGGQLMWIGDEEVRARLARVADERWATRAYRQRLRRRDAYFFDGLSAEALAWFWVSENDKPRVRRGPLHDAFSAYCGDIARENPNRALDMVLAVLEDETDPRLLSLLAAGPLEDAIPRGIIDRVEEEAARNRRFHELVGSVWFTSYPEDLIPRMERLVATIPVDGAGATP